MPLSMRNSACRRAKSVQQLRFIAATVKNPGGPSIALARTTMGSLRVPITYERDPLQKYFAMSWRNLITFASAVFLSFTMCHVSRSAERDPPSLDALLKLQTDGNFKDAYDGLQRYLLDSRPQHSADAAHRE